MTDRHRCFLLFVLLRRTSQSFTLPAPPIPSHLHPPTRALQFGVPLNAGEELVLRPPPLLIWAPVGGTSADGIAGSASASASALGREMRADGKEERRPAQTDGAEQAEQRSEGRESSNGRGGRREGGGEEEEEDLIFVKKSASGSQ